MNIEWSENQWCFPSMRHVSPNKLCIPSDGGNRHERFVVLIHTQTSMYLGEPRESHHSSSCFSYFRNVTCSPQFSRSRSKMLTRHSSYLREISLWKLVVSSLSSPRVNELARGSFFSFLDLTDKRICVIVISFKGREVIVLIWAHVLNFLFSHVDKKFAKYKLKLMDR